MSRPRILSTSRIVCDRFSSHCWPLYRATSPGACLHAGYPASVDAAVRLLQSLVPEAEQERIKALAEDELWSLHNSLGQWTRNHMGLWGANNALLDATGQTSADDASGVVVRAFWEQLRSSQPKLH